MNIPTPAPPFGSVVTAMATPFDAQGALDTQRAQELARHLADNGTTGLVVTGTTGESPTLTPDEKLDLYRAVQDAVEIPIIANTGDNETAFSIEFSQQVAKLNVDALLLVVPYYNRPNQEGLYQHFAAIAQSVELPCILYNVPDSHRAQFGSRKPSRVLSRNRQHCWHQGSQSGDLTQIAHNSRAHADDDFWIYSGNDGDTYSMLEFGRVAAWFRSPVALGRAGKPMRAMMEAFNAKRLAACVGVASAICCRFTKRLFPASSPSPAPVKAGIASQRRRLRRLAFAVTEIEPKDLETLRAAMHTAHLL